jgi:beta-xylosidase
MAEKLSKLLFLIICLVVVLTVSCNQKKTTPAQVHIEEEESGMYTNPVIAGDFADPSIIRVEDTYYSVGTSSEWGPHFPMLTSKDLVNWEQKSYTLKEKPTWAASSFWAPELFYKNETFYLYYVAKRKSDGVSCIGVATSQDPENGFTDEGILLSYGKEAIDPFVFEDQGQLYVSWKAYGLDERPIELLASKLSKDGLKVEGEPFSILKDDNSRGIEGQYIVKNDNYYYLFYSEGGCCGKACDYDVRVARSKSLRETFEKFEGNPILKANGQWKCPGHGTLVETPDNRWYYMYHAYSQNDDIYTGRQALLDEILWNEVTGWPEFQNTNSPSIKARLPFKNEKQQVENEISDEFNSASLSKFWQWDFRNSQPSIVLEKGLLSLSGRTEVDNNTGTVLTIRPAFGDYEFYTEVSNKNSSLKGLVLYGDVGKAVGIGVSGNTVQLWEVKENNRNIMAEKLLDTNEALNLKIEVENGYKLKFFWSLDKENWQELSANDSEFYDGKFLPQWDRSARPGLIHYGETDNPALFSNFELSYNKQIVTE